MRASTRGLIALGRDYLATLDSELLADIVFEIVADNSGLECANTLTKHPKGENVRGVNQAQLDVFNNSDIPLSKGSNPNLKNNQNRFLDLDSRESDFEQVTEFTVGETTVNGNQSGYTVEFERFWKAYPRKVGKRAAFKAWKGAKKREQVETIMLAVKEFAESEKGQSKKFCPHPSTWLNQDRWNDDSETWNEDKISEETEIEFNAFYALYPKKGNRQTALIAFNEVVKDDRILAKVISSVRVFAQSPKGLSEYAPAAASWLKQRWFDDDPKMWNTEQQKKRIIKL